MAGNRRIELGQQRRGCRLGVGLWMLNGVEVCGDSAYRGGTVADAAVTAGRPRQVLGQGIGEVVACSP